MDESELDLAFWQISAKFGRESLEVAQKDGFIFGAWVEKRRGVLVVAVKLIIFGRGRKTENINLVVFVGLIKEKVNIVEILEIIEKFWTFTGEPVMFATEATLEMRRFAVKIVIAGDDEYRGDLAELIKPGQ